MSEILDGSLLFFIYCTQKEWQVLSKQITKEFGRQVLWVGGDYPEHFIWPINTVNFCDTSKISESECFYWPEPRMPVVLYSDAHCDNSAAIPVDEVIPRLADFLGVNDGIYK